MQPKELLFKRPFREENKPLFNTQVELAETLVRKKYTPDQKDWENQVNSMKVFINQCVNGKRKLPQDLEQLMLEVIESRIAPDLDLNFKKQIRLSFDQKLYAEKEKSKKSISLQSDYERFLERSKEASKIFVSTCEPAEIKRTEESEKILEGTLNRMGLLSRNDEIPNYKYCFPSVKIAEDFWEGLYKYADKKVTAAGSKLKDANNKGIIRVFKASSLLTLYPIVALDVGENEETAFFVSYNKYNNDRPSVAVLSTEVFRQWKEKVYSDIDKKIDKMDKEDDKSDQNEDYDDNFLEIKFSKIYENYKSNQEFM